MSSPPRPRAPEADTGPIALALAALPFLAYGVGGHAHRPAALEAPHAPPPR